MGTKGPELVQSFVWLLTEVSGTMASPKREVGGSSVYGAVRLRSAPYFVMATDSAIYNGPLDATSLAIFTAPFRGPTVILRGTLGNAAAAVPITFTCPSTSVIAATNGAICWFDGSDATFWGTPSTGVALFQGTAATPVRFAPFAHGAKWKRVGLATTGVTVTAGESTDLDIRFSDSYADNQLSVNTNGTVDRDSVEISAAASPGSGTYGVPFPSGASLFVSGTPTGTTSVGVSAVSATGYTLTSGSATTFNGRAVRRR